MRKFIVIISLFLDAAILFSNPVSVGTLQGNLEVDMSGAATYSIPIYAPPGTNGMQPNISLVYSSLAGSGIMGAGWNIGGLSAISRVPQNRYFDNNIQGLQYNNTDRFMLDGQRIMPLDGYANNGLDGKAYRQENDNFSRIYSYSNSTGYPNYFMVYGKDGSVIEYKEMVIDPRTGVPISWLITKIIDANDNYMIFEYNDHYGSSIVVNQSDFYGLPYYHQGDVSIRSIKYTGNASVNPQLLPYNEIWFHYDNNNNYERWYGNNKRLFSSKYRLSRIESKADGQLVRKYEFEYDDNSSTTQYYLKSIKESNSDEEYYNSTTFIWDKSLAHTNNGVQYNSSDYYPVPLHREDNFGRYETNQNIDENMERLVGDLNGDGLSDVLAFKGINNSLFLAKIGINNGNEGFEIRDFTNNPIPDCSGVILLDENGDGKDELIVVYEDNNRYHIAFYEFRSNFTWKWYKTYKMDVSNAIVKFGNYHNDRLPAYNNGAAYTSLIQFADIDGDGRPDLIYFDQGVSAFYAVLNKSSYYERTTILSHNNNSIYNEFYNPTYSARTNRRLLISDVNGDGLSDAVIFVNGNVEVYFSNGNGSFSSLGIPALTGQFTSNQDWNENHEIQMLDLNGDGLSDIIGIKDGIISIGLSLGDRFIFNHNNGSIGRPNDDKAILKYPLQLRDVNNDGLPDMVFFSDNGVEILLNSNTGTNGNTVFPKFVSAGIAFTGFHPTDYWDEKLKRTAGDFNGDGVVDIFAFAYDHSAILKGKPSYPARITEITDGLGNTAKINYQYRRNDFTVSYSFLPVGPSILVDSVIKNANGIGEIFHTKYSFYNPVFERTGKGFMGFRNVEILDSINNAKTVTESKLVEANHSNGGIIHTGHFSSLNGQTQTPVMLPISTQKWIGGNLVSAVENVSYLYYAFVDHYGAIDDSYVILPREIKEYNYIDNTLKTIFNTYEAQYPANSYPPANNCLPRSTDNIDLKIQTIHYHDGVNQSSQMFTESRRMAYTNIGTRNFKLAYDTIEKKLFFNPNDPNPFPHRTCTTYEYNGANLSKATVTVAFYPFKNPLTRATQYAYDGFGNLTSKNEDGRVSSYEYDSKGQFLTKETDYAIPNQPVTYAYENKYGNLISKTVGSSVTNHAYDAWGRLLSTAYPDGSALYYGKLKWGDAPCSYYEEVRKNNSTGTLLNTKHYNSMGNEIKSIAYSGFEGANNVATTTEYNNKGLVSKKTGPNGSYWTEYAYDAYNRLTSEITEPEQKHVEYEYNGRTTMKRDVLAGVEYISTKDVIGRTVKVTDPGGDINYTYNSLSLPVTVTSIDNMTTTLQYDAFGNRFLITEPNSGTTKFEYNNFGQLISQTDAEATSYGYIYNPTTGRLMNERILSPNGVNMNVIYAYNPAGLLQNVHSDCTLNPAVAIHDENYQYDSKNRLTRKQSMLAAHGAGIPNITVAGNFITSFEYNTPQSSSVSKIIYPTGLEVTYHYDVYGELRSLFGHIPDLAYSPINTRNMCSISRNPVRTNGGLLYPEVPFIHYKPNTKNHFNQITGYVCGNDLETSYSFGAFGELESIYTRSTSNGPVIQTLAYEYNNRGLLTKKNCGVTGQREEYTYDGLDRLVRVNRDTSSPLIMNYDQKGNIMQKSDFGDYIYTDNDKPNAMKTVQAIGGFNQSANTIVSYLFGNKPSRFAYRHSISLGNLSNTALYYGFDKQRIISVDVQSGISKISNDITVRKFVDKYYEEEWYFVETCSWATTPAESSPYSLKIGNDEFYGYRAAIRL